MPAETHTTSDPVSPDEVLTLVRTTLADILEIPEERIKIGRAHV